VLGRHPHAEATFDLVVRRMTPVCGGGWLTVDPAGMQDGRFHVEVSDDGRRAVLAARGEIDLGTVDDLRDAIERATESRSAEVWVDLSDVAFMDSTGLSALVVGHRALPGRFVVICPDGPPRRALEICGLHEVLRMYRDVDDVDG
jgi:anti-sigma B factor antagonist